MKKILIACVLFVSLGASAQETKEKVPGLKSFAAVKWNPESLALGKVSLFGEYNYKKKKSITFGIGIPYEKKRTIEMDGEDRDFTMKTFSVMGGYRMYLGKKSMTGFYFEPYLKYMKNEGATSFNADISGSKTVFSLNSNYSGFGAGAQLGVQARLFKVILLDFFLLGPEANMAKHEVVMQDVQGGLPWNYVQEQDAKKELEDNLKDLPVIGKKIEVTVDKNQRKVSTKYDGFLPGIRLGASIGIRF